METDFGQGPMKDVKGVIAGFPRRDISRELADVFRNLRLAVENPLDELQIRRTLCFWIKCDGGQPCDEVATLVRPTQPRSQVDSAVLYIQQMVPCIEDLCCCGR